ncbi:unnamed protein product [Microthlaspi erraticum]|uniref:FBD domain-containing protein n=1 Tax=Microthlaspi erraticum TaxID=1685480 RepID=A0A6D2HL70_9BRAS|nr:unnamed protein product [Microthlaspi erraticum]
MSKVQAGLAHFLHEASSSDLEIHYSEGHEENEMVGNATDFIVGISSVKILYLSAETLEVLTYCCEAIPLFINLTRLTVESKPEIGWQSLPGLLKNSPNLETLVLQGLGHKATVRCGDMCLCEPFEEEMEEEEEIPPCCLSSSPVKVLKILKFGKIYDDEIEQVKLFLEMMPNLEQLIIHCDESFGKDLVEVSNQLQMLPRVASPKCNVQLISGDGHVSLSSTVTSSSMK